MSREIWQARTAKLSRNKFILFRLLRIVALSFQRFRNDRCSLRASALTFYSLLSIVPVFAMAFGIAKGFGLDDRLRGEVLSNMQGQETVVRQVIDFAYSLLQNTKGGVVAGIGIIFLAWTIVRLLANIEEAFNDIWGVQQGRSWARKFAEYLSLMLVIPMFLVISGSLNLFIINQINQIAQSDAFFGLVSPALLSVLAFFPFFVIIGLLSFLYIYMPNTRVTIPAGIWGGLIAGVIYQIAQWAYINFQIRAANFGAIYGSFAALPLFLIWLQTSWLIVLLGAEISFAYQNSETYEFEQAEKEHVSFAIKKVLAVRILQICAERYQNLAPPPIDNEIAEMLEIPARLCREILQNLVVSGLLASILKDGDKESAFLPAMPVEQMNLSKILQSLEHLGNENLHVRNSREFSEIAARMEAIEHEIEKSPLNIPIKQILRVPPLLSPEAQAGD